MQQKLEETFPRPAWYAAGIWLGCDFFGLLRLLIRNRFRVRPSYLPDCLIDLLFGVAHTGLRALQELFYGPAVDRIELRKDPILIIGHWRTGTTLLHELLALDPRNRCPTTAECFAPNHFLLTGRLLSRWNRFLLPRNRPPDRMQMGWNLPQEDEFALCNLGVPSPYATIAFPNHPPQFQEYFGLDDLSDAQRRRWSRALSTFLKQLIYKRPGRLVLKSPPHTFRLPTLDEMFPEARLIHMVRNPYVLFMSTVRLWKSLYAAHGYQKPNFEGIEQYVFETLSRMHDRLEATRGLIDPARFLDVRYEDLVRDPVGQMRTIYDQLGLGNFDTVEPAIRKYFQKRAAYKTNRYELTPELRAEIGRRWKPYIERYGYAGGGDPLPQ